MESTKVVSRGSCGVLFAVVILGERTEHEFLGRRKHIKRESHFILVLLLLHPFREIGGLGEKEGEGGY